MEEQNQNWKDVVYEQDPEEKKQKKGNSFFAALLALFSAFCVSIGFK